MTLPFFIFQTIIRNPILYRPLLPPFKIVILVAFCQVYAERWRQSPPFGLTSAVLLVIKLKQQDQITYGHGCQMGFSLAGFLKKNRAAIITQWVDQLKARVSPRYAERPRKELISTVTEAYDANTHVLLHNDFSYIDRFIEKISQMRLKAGFSLSDVQMAFELYRTVVPPLIASETTVEEFLAATTRINNCLTYTIHRFSNYFQAMHQNKILEHNRQLEEDVRARTAELKESELKYKTLVEEINDGYFVVRNEEIVFANPAFCMMHGYQLDEVIGKKFYTFIDTQSRKKFIAIYEKSFQKRGTPRTFEYLRLTRDGQSYPTEILAKITLYDNKLSTIGICRDITQRVRMEQKIRETERMAYIGQITTSLSHEIRNPLSAVQMNLQILKKSPKLKGNDERRIDISVREVKRLENILKQLLDFAKPVHLNFNRNSLNTILISSMELLEMKFKEKNIALDIELDPDIPDIQADEEKLGQAVINLLLNALEASPAGSQIKVRSRYNSQNGRNAELVISDRGGGVPEKHLNDIFKPFFTTKTMGTGLGLCNVKRIAEAHDGRIEVKNLREGGTAFKISLPF
jgi:PAS domain S-box-containing protein